jgi:hypothetical protein
MYVFLERFAELAAEAGEETTEQLSPQLLNVLDHQPPVRNYPSQYPIEWTSEKQRRAYFATDGFGAGIPYQRTGKLAAAWRVITERTANGFRLLIENPLDAARFVYGSLAKNPQAARRFQQQYHAKTGWIFAQPIVMDWLEKYRQQYKANLGKRIVAMKVQIKQRAITPRLRR